MSYKNLFIIRSTWILIFFLSSASYAETMTIPIHDQHQPPLVIIEKGHYKGIYTDLFREILLRANIQPRFVPTPKKRVRILFEKGESVITCCDNPAWRTRPKEQLIQLFSKPFYSTRDVFIFPLGKRFPIETLESLSDKKVAVVRGYGYRGQEWFGERLDLGSEAELIAFVALKRADVGIINHDVVKNWLMKNDETIEIGDTHDIASLHLRIHRKRHDLMETLNKSIDSIISDGTVDRIVKKYLED